MKKSSNWILNLLLGVLAIASIFIIIIVGLDITSLKHTINDKDFADNMNKVLLNISYSYITGYLVYSLSVLLPHYFNKKKIRGVVEQKYETIKGKLKDSIRCVYPMTKWNDDIYSSKESLLNQFENTSVFQSSSYKPAGMNLTVIELLKGQGSNIDNIIGQLIEYRDFLSPESMVFLEGIRESAYFKYLNVFAQIRMLDQPSERRKLGEELFNLYDKVKTEGLKF